MTVARAPRRGATPSSLRRASTVALAVGTVLAVASAFGPVWVVRAGVVAACLAAVLASALAWRELRAARRVHGRQMVAAAQQHGAALREERARNADIVGVLSERLRAAGATIDKQRSRIAELMTQVSRLHGERGRLAVQTEQQAEVITTLRSEARERELALKAREDELRALREAEQAAIRHMPRRMRLDAVPDEPPAETEAELLDRAGRRAAIDLSTVLPNYEVQQRVG